MIQKRLLNLALVLLVLVLIAAAPVALRERIGIDSPVDSYIFNGSDIIWYSDAHNNETARVEGVTGNITNDGDITVGDDLVVTDDATIGGNVILTSATQAITAGTSIVPSAAYLVLTSTGEYTTSATAAITTTGILTGQLLIIRNGNASDVIHIDGTGGTVECKANLDLGASDTEMFIFNGSDWNCVPHDNS